MKNEYDKNFSLFYSKYLTGQAKKYARFIEKYYLGQSTKIF